MNRFFTVRVVIIALIVWLVLCLIVVGSVFIFSPFKVVNVVPTAVITLVNAPTQMPDVSQAATLPANGNSNTPSAPAIHVGNFVQITGTQGEGLRIRSAPGVENNLLFIANEAEVFEVKDGPVLAGDYTWWYLVSPKDPSRYGWAAGNYLLITNQP